MTVTTQSVDDVRLGIGKVLERLREEFPDLTLSKIRYLVSQGLVRPDRSPSGYRQFAQSDMTRLVWLLRQQREPFLPLRVIRELLDTDPLKEQRREAIEHPLARPRREDAG